MTDSPYGTLAVIADPRAGRGRVASALPAVQRAVAATGLSYRLEVSEGPDDTTRLASAALDEGLRYVVAVGDDATVHHVVNGMFRDGRTILERPVLAVIPAGAGADLMRSFGMPEDVEAAAAHLTGANVYPFDVMKVAVTAGSERIVSYAHNVAGVGFHAKAWQRTATFARFGNAARFLGFWTSYATERVRELRLEADTRSESVRAWSVVVGNGQFADGGIRWSPRSFPGDGILDALVFTGPKSDAYRLLPRVFRHGDHIPDPNVRELRAKLRLSVDAGRALPVVADGIALGTTPVTFQVVPQQILLKL
jgi:diacylglycerol kinase (ATP)